MFKWFQKPDESDRLLKIMKTNRSRVIISKNGVVRLNLEDKDVQDKIRKDMEKLGQLEAM
ncbi:hypothetical protein BWI06_RS13140 [Vibrio parahaemolyticus]|uniref:hypothetical protein n=1 Tax=Vibrio parahaemolyticus TaxID=670 RepID=UPI0005F1BB12|nr:hypothetical protein [Vibrio parahaemolyticus]ELA7820159.1 hypothetical protein [Vibrio alginolyticus]EJE4558006.1 hypothetical protein [Vibrio parahaemolyticus]EJG1766249.1 hypothetical protein [Vibrio parahaemolyticus]ELA7364748.1 hypothetical protein [Vibrio parahaemolyticus]HCE5171378.1 hypothetical protein [Vibrio parahaemolyticus]